MDDAAPRGLPDLEAQIARDLELLSYPHRPWLPQRSTSRGEPVLDVLVIGGGQSGLVCAAALMREKVQNLLVIDDNPEDRAGPWLNFARMITLRTPKYLTGPDLGIPSLTIQSWYEAQHGQGSWESMGLIPKETWAEYLAWYRKVMKVPVSWQTTAGAAQWDAGERAFCVPLRQKGEERTVWARRIVFCTGIDGAGHWKVPAFIEESLPQKVYSHTRWPIDFDALRGKRVAVLGAGASAFDNAACALEHGAAEVRLFFRRPALVNVNPYRWAEFVGFLRNIGDMPDAIKWRFIKQILRMGQLPPKDTYERAKRFENFSLHPKEPWKSVRMVGDEVEVTTPERTARFDFLILGTGFTTDLSQRPELANLVPHVALWKDRYTPPTENADEDLGRHPYLGSSFEFTQKTPGEAPWLGYAFHYTFGCLLSLGFGGASISGMKYSIPKLVGGVTRSLFEEDIEEHYKSLCNFAEAEFE